MTTTLLQIQAEGKRIYAYLEALRDESDFSETGEIGGDYLEELLTKLDDLDAAFDDKVGAYLHVIDRLESDADRLAADKAAIAARERQVKGEIERLRAFLAQQMVIADRRTLKTPTATVSARVLTGQEVQLLVDASELPDQFAIVSRKPDLTAIKTALTTGDFNAEAIAEFVEKAPRPSLTIRRPK